MELPDKFDDATEFPDLIKDSHTAKFFEILFNSRAYYSASVTGGVGTKEARACFGRQYGKTCPVLMMWSASREYTGSGVRCGLLWKWMFRERGEMGVRQVIVWEDGEKFSLVGVELGRK
jgi:hypothetical protein